MLTDLRFDVPQREAVARALMPPFVVHPTLELRIPGNLALERRYRDRIGVYAPFYAFVGMNVRREAARVPAARFLRLDGDTAIARRVLALLVDNQPPLLHQ